MNLSNNKIIFHNLYYTYTFDKIYNIYQSENKLYVNDKLINNLDTLTIYVNNDKFDFNSIQPHNKKILNIDFIFVKDIVDLLILNKYDFNTAKNNLNNLIDIKNNSLLDKIKEIENSDNPLDLISEKYIYIHLLNIETIKNIYNEAKKHKKPVGIVNRTSYYNYSYNETNVSYILNICETILANKTVKYKIEDFFMKKF